MSTEDFKEQNITEQLRKQQDLSYAIVGGATAALVGAVVWAVITVSTQYQIGYMAIGLGLLVGMSVRFFGAGVDQVYQIIGAVMALLGCLLGNLFSQVGFIANAQSLGYFETLTYLDFDLIKEIYAESFSPMDLLFYGIAVYEGYRFSIRPATDEIIHEFNSTGKISPQKNNHLRFPLVLGSFISMGLLVYFLSGGTSGHKVYTFESGAKMSEGDLVNGKEDGEWQYWYEEGPLQLKAHYTNGVENGAWEWYDSASHIVRKGSYKNGLFDGTWINFYTTGTVSDSGNYVEGRMEGPWIVRYENGRVSQSGSYHRDRNEGAWSFFFENGNLSSQGVYEKGMPTKLWKYWFENGQPKEEIEHVSDSLSKLISAWDETGKQVVSNGNGKLLVKGEEGNILESGDIKDGIRTGKWLTYFADGKKQEEGEYKNGQYYLLNSWTADGKPQVTNGAGDYALYQSNNSIPSQSGTILNGLRQGMWTTFHPLTSDTLLITNYQNGKLNGPNRTFFSNGLIYVEGNFINNKKDGEWNWYYESGGLQTSVTYKENKKEGVQVFWSEGGKKSKEEHYKNNELISENLITDED